MTEDFHTHNQSEMGYADISAFVDSCEQKVSTTSEDQLNTNIYRQDQENLQKTLADIDTAHEITGVCFKAHALKYMKEVFGANNKQAREQQRTSMLYMEKQKLELGDKFGLVWLVLKSKDWLTDEQKADDESDEELPP